MFSFHLPADIAAWCVFAFGLLLVAYRIHGIDAPRTWVEWMERRFTYAIHLRFIGGILILTSATASWFVLPKDVIGILFTIAMAVLALAGFGLLVLQNHARALILATAESSDAMIRIMSIIVVVIGLCFMAAPFFL
jgi:uncharacterized protein YjeT (DUF2065 family)